MKEKIEEISLSMERGHRRVLRVLGVLLAIGLKHEVAHGSLRLSFSDTNDESDIDYILEVLPPIVNRLRAMSPLWDAIIHGRTVE